MKIIKLNKDINISKGTEIPNFGNLTFNLYIKEGSLLLKCNFGNVNLVIEMDKGRILTTPYKKQIFEFIYKIAINNGSKEEIKN